MGTVEQSPAREASLEALIETELLQVESLHPGGLELTEEFAELCEVRRGSDVLELACGTGESACRAEIEAALKQPRWATTWPEWQAAFDRFQADLGYEPQAGGMTLLEKAEAEAEDVRQLVEELRRMQADSEA